MFHADPRFVEKLVKSIFPNASKEDNSMVIHHNLYISLNKNSCGKLLYTNDFIPMPRKERTFILNSSIPKDNQWSDFVREIINKKGWRPENVVNHILKELDMSISWKQRFSFCQKPLYEHTLLDNTDNKDYEYVIKNSFPFMFDKKVADVYWYKTENGKIYCGNVIFSDKFDKMHSLPISAWRQFYPKRLRNIEYDLLCPPGKLPIYNLNKIKNHNESKHVLICKNEYYAEIISSKYSKELDKTPVTTYMDMYNTDWSTIYNYAPVILSELSEDGILESYNLYEVLEKENLKPLFVVHNPDIPLLNETFREDVKKIKCGEGLCSLREFAEHNLKVHGIVPPKGIRLKARRLSSTPSARKPKEALIKDLFDLHETMTIYAKAGVGKSMISLLLALSFVSGEKILDEYVCPSRAYKVVLIDGELNQDDIYTRATKLCKGHALPDDAPTQIDFLLAREGDVSDNLESENAQKEIETDLDKAEIIIIDSVFMFFPSAMDSKAENTTFLREFITRWKKRGKTLIIIDHQGKTNTGALGSSTKEFLLDVIIRLEKNNNKTYIKVDKVRNHPPITGSYLTLENQSSADGEMIKFKVIDGSSTTKRPDASLAPKIENTLQGNQKLSIEQVREIIKEYIKKNPNAKQKDIVASLKPITKMSESSLARRILNMRKTGDLGFWNNQPNRGKKASRDSAK